MLRGSDVLLVLLRRFWLLVIGALAGAALGLLVTNAMTPNYQANLSMMVVTDSAEVENTAAYDYTQAYGQLPNLPAVAGGVLSGYGIEPTQENIEETINVEVPPNTPLFQITTNARSADQAAGIANDLGEEITAFVSDRLAPGTGYRALVVAEASTPQAPASPDGSLNVAVGVFLGLLLGGGVALIWDDFKGYRKRRRHSGRPGTSGS